MVGSSFVTVGTLRSNVVAITAPIVYPGGALTPVIQWRLGLLYSGTNTSAAAELAVPAQFAFALAQVNAVTNADSPLYAAAGRETVVALPSQARVME